jgi:membrane associated rhomboid family serine protease
MDNRGNSFLGYIPPIVKNLIVINLLFWLAGISLVRFFPDFDLNNVFGMHYWGSEKFNVSQLVSYMFMHASFEHVFMNMFGLFMFGRVLEQFWGPKRFLLFYFVTGIGAGVIQQLFWTIEYNSLIQAMNQGIAENSAEALIPFEQTLRRYLQFGNLEMFTAVQISEMKQMFVDSLVTVGASGALFGLLLAFGMMFPNQPIFFMFIPIPIKAKYFIIGYAVIELFLGVSNFRFDSIAHFAHLGGMLFGFFLIQYWRKNQFRQH